MQELFEYDKFQRCTYTDLGRRIFWHSIIIKEIQQALTSIIFFVGRMHEHFFMIISSWLS